MKTFALVTGASSGIGEACAELLAKAGRNLILIARREERLASLKEKFESEYGVEVLTYKVDVSDLGQVEKFFAEIAGREVDVLVNNAGLALGKAVFDEHDWKDIEQMIDVNIKAFTRVAQLTIPFLRKTKGHIVNISSIAGREAYEGATVYCATKAYVKMMNQALRIDVHGSGVRVTDIAPGAVDTEFSEVRFKGDAEKAEAVYKGFVPLYAVDVAECVMFALGRPASVNIDSIVVMPTAQATVMRVARDV